MSIANFCCFTCLSFRWFEGLTHNVKLKTFGEHCHGIGAFCKNTIFRRAMMIIILEMLLQC